MANLFEEDTLERDKVDAKIGRSSTPITREKLIAKCLYKSMQKTYRNVANLTTDLSREFSRRLRKPRENASKERIKIIKKHAMEVI